MRHYSLLAQGALVGCIFLALSLQLGAVALAVPPQSTGTYGSGYRASFGEAWRTVKKELQIYRGPRLERVSDLLAVGRSRFDRNLSLQQNLEQVVQEKQIPHYYAAVNGRQVLHLVIELGLGGKSSERLRQVYGRIGQQSIEINYKARTQQNTWGHVAVRTGMRATYDLTGTARVAALPRLLERAVQALTGKSSLTFARRRNLRRFMESRQEPAEAADQARLEGDLYYGLLYAATPEDISATARIYEQRMASLKSFKVSGGDSAKGEYSCAQFLSGDVPYINQLGIKKNIGAASMAQAARGSDKLEAVIVYKTPSVSEERVEQFR